MLFAVSRAWDKEKILSLYEESNLRPSDSEPQCSAKGLLRFKSLRGHSVFPSSCALDQTNHVLFYFLIFSTAMWCCFGVSLIKFVVAYTSVLHFFFFYYRRGYLIVRDTVSFLQTALIWVKNDTFCSILYRFFTHCRLINLVFTSLSQEFR